MLLQPVRRHRYQLAAPCVCLVETQQLATRSPRRVDPVIITIVIVIVIVVVIVLIIIMTISLVMMIV